jgi:hypothetical protein
MGIWVYGYMGIEGGGLIHHTVYRHRGIEEWGLIHHTVYSIQYRGMGFNQYSIHNTQVYIGTYLVDPHTHVSQ